MNTEYEKKWRAYRARKEMPFYIKRLESLLLTPKEMFQFIDPDDGVEISDKLPVLWFEFPFTEKDKIRKIIEAAAAIRDGEGYLYVKGAEDCGELRIKSLLEIDLSMKIDPMEMDCFRVSLIDGSNCFWIDVDGYNGIFDVEVKLIGHDWTKVKLEE